MPSNHKIVVNWHVTEACNYKCQFCYAHWARPKKPDLWRDTDLCNALISELSQFFHIENSLWANFVDGQARLNIAGGEPALWGDHLHQTVAIGVKNGFDVSLISNGSRPDALRLVAEQISMLGISVDSTNPCGNAQIGRADPKGTQITNAELINLVRGLRKKNPNLTIKINTVVNAVNAEEDFSSLIAQISPDRWKILRMLPSHTNALAIDDEAFHRFVVRHMGVNPEPSIEDNDEMVHSYLMIDPQGRFFQNKLGAEGYDYSDPILKVGAAEAFSQIPFSFNKFVKRYHKSGSGE